MLPGEMGGVFGGYGFFLLRVIFTFPIPHSLPFFFVRKD